MASGDGRRKYPIRSEEYELCEVVGQGVSASVYRARCISLDEVVAIKVLDFERDNSDFNNIMREAQTMILIDHPNVLKAHCSFVNDHNLWVVMPYMAGGSCLHIMKSVHPHGFEEVVIATILRDVLKGLEYLHRHGHIHRDVKAGNILVDSKGAIKLGDFGVSACLFDSGDRQRNRNTFVGTPCWMAPEVMEQLHGYDFKADIWSFGITALELAHGHAPFSKYPPMKVLLMTLQNAPPGLDYERDKKFSRNFKHMVAMCLVKDPTKRPTAHKLLKQPFFKQARSQEYFSRKILDGLPTLVARFKALKEKDEDLLAQKKMPDGEKEEISQNEYKRGISSWEFDIDDLKTQASLIPDNDDTGACKESEVGQGSMFEIDGAQDRVTGGRSLDTSLSMKLDPNMEFDATADQKSSPNSSPEQNACSSIVGTDGKDSSLANLTIRKHSTLSCCELEFDEKISDVLPTFAHHERRFSSSSCSSASLLADVLSSEAINRAAKSSSLNSDGHDDRLKPPVIQQRGRFKITSENVDKEKAHTSASLQKSHSMQIISQVPTINTPYYMDAVSTPPGYHP